MGKLIHEKVTIVLNLDWTEVERGCRVKSEDREHTECILGCLYLVRSRYIPCFNYTTLGRDRTFTKAVTSEVDRGNIASIGAAHTSCC